MTPIQSPLTANERQSLGSITIPFELIYRRVTSRARIRWRTLRDGGERMPARWLAYLVAHFRRHYREWPTNTDLAAYFRIFLKRRVTRLVRLSGFVYLHIAHDLPLVIADSLSVRGKNNPPNVDLNRIRSVYMSLNADFTSLLHEALRNGDIGLRGRVIGILPGAGLACRVLGQWVLALRMVSWTHGEMLHAWGPNPSHRQRLHRAVLDAAEKAASKFWILGLPIQPPTLAVASPLLIFDSSPTLVVAGVLLTIAAVYAWWRYEARVIDHLGYLMYVEVLRSFDEIAQEMKTSS